MENRGSCLVDRGQTGPHIEFNKTQEKVKSAFSALDYYIFDRGRIQN